MQHILPKEAAGKLCTEFDKVFPSFSFTLYNISRGQLEHLRFTNTLPRKSIPFSRCFLLLSGPLHILISNTFLPFAELSMEFPKRLGATCLQVINKLRDLSFSLALSFPPVYAWGICINMHVPHTVLYATCGTSSIWVPSLREINWHFNHLCTSFRTPTAKKGNSGKIRRGKNYLGNALCVAKCEIVKMC